jgi:hypothetical protein
VVAKPNAIPPAETAVTPDANDLARAAIERLRGSAPEVSPRAPETSREAVRVPEVPHVVAAPVPAAVTAPPVQPLPPPILVSTPPAESPAKPGYDPHRPTPPADIPDPRPLDLRADAVDSPPHRPSVAEDMLSAAKSVFHSVIPK